MDGLNLKNVAFIPVRGGSKGFPGKNIRLINHKPLVAWSIEQALDSRLIDEIYVSTDCENIAEIAESFGAKVPFLRPPGISGDTATTESAMVHFCNWLGDQSITAENILLLQATSPVRAEGRLDQALTMFESHRYDSLLSVSESHRFFWRKDCNGELLADYDFTKRPRRQDIKDKDRRYIETGSFYISNLKGFMIEQNRLFGNIGIFVTPENESYEIDTVTDFKLCEILLEELYSSRN